MITQSLAEGAPGAALLAVEQGENARPWLAEMVAVPVMAHPDEANLFEGAPAVAFTLAATGQPRALSTLDKHVDSITRTRLDAAHRRIDRGELPAKREFDLISGLTGLGAYLLHRHGGGELLREVLAYLVRLTEPRRDGLPGWWALDGPTGPGPDWRGGHGNPGMAHGIAGSLALLALAMRRGLAVDGHADAMRRICRWLDQFRGGEPPRNWWPEALTRAQHDRGTPPEGGPYRPSWCYGTPGIARAQQLAGLALGDPQRQRLAHDALAWCVTDETQLAQLGDVSLCHGWAGLLYTAWRAGVHDDRIRAAVPRLLDGLADALRHQPPHERGLLVGETGALLTQHAVTANTPPVTQWDACLLLND
ncbi:MAG: lanthionine synthetase C family protein [Pseudonocardiaceae bacterium]